MGLFKLCISLLIINSIATTGYLTYTFIDDKPNWDICEHLNISLILCDIFIILGVITFITYKCIVSRNNIIGMGLLFKMGVILCILGFIASHIWLMKIVITENTECRDYLKEEHKDYWDGIIWTLSGFSVIVFFSGLSICRHLCYDVDDL